MIGLYDSYFELAGKFLCSKGVHMESKLEAHKIRQLLAEFRNTLASDIEDNFQGWLHSIIIPENGELGD